MVIGGFNGEPGPLLKNKLWKILKEILKHALVLLNQVF